MHWCSWIKTKAIVWSRKLESKKAWFGTFESVNWKGFWLDGDQDFEAVWKFQRHQLWWCRLWSIEDEHLQ